MTNRRGRQQKQWQRTSLWALSPVLAPILAGCVSIETLRLSLDGIELDPPAKTWILAQIRPNTEMVLVVVDAEHGALGLEQLPVLEAYDGSDQVQFTALAYEASTADLGIEPGRAIPSQPGELGSGLPTPEATFVRVVSEDDDGEWQPRSTLPAELRGFRSLAFSFCVRWESVTFELETEEQVSASVELGDGSALIALKRRFGWEAPSSPSNQFLRVNFDGVQPLDGPLAADATTIARHRVNAMHRDDNGRLWLATVEPSTVAGTNEGRVAIWSASLEEGLGRRILLPAKTWWVRELESAPGGRTIYALSDCGELTLIDVETFDRAPVAQGWPTLLLEGRQLQAGCSRVPHVALDQSHPRDQDFQCGHLVRAGGGLLVLLNQGRHTRWIDFDSGPTLTSTAIEMPEDAEFEAVVHADNVSFGIASDALVSDFYRLENGRFAPFVSGIPSQRMYAASTFRSGFVVSGVMGFVTEFSPPPGPGLCGSQPGPGGSIGTFAITSLGQETYLFTGRTPRMRTVVGLIRPQP